MPARLPAHEVTVVQIDAHLDMRADDSDYNDHDPSPFAHSCVMRRAHEMGFRDLLDRHPGLCAATSISTPASMACRCSNGAAAPCPRSTQIMAAIATEQVYLTVDVDGFDPAVAPATGTPVPGGLSWDYGTGADPRPVRGQGRDRRRHRRGGAAVGSGLTEYAAAQLCYDMVALQAAQAGR